MFRQARRVYCLSRHGEAAVSTQAEERHRSLFKVPVYRSDIAFNASFDLPGVPANAPHGAVLDWNRAELLVGASDARGAQSDIMLEAAGDKASRLGPQSFADRHRSVCRAAGYKKLTFFGTSARPGATRMPSSTSKPS